MSENKQILLAQFNFMANVRTKNCLKSEGLTVRSTVEDFLKAFPTARSFYWKNIPNLGAKSKTEVIRQLYGYVPDEWMPDSIWRQCFMADKKSMPLNSLPEDGLKVKRIDGWAAVIKNPSGEFTMDSKIYPSKESAREGRHNLLACVRVKARDGDGL